MIPQPPFASDLSPEQERDAFRALQPRLSDLWHVLNGAEDGHCTSVVVPSLTLDQQELSKLSGVAYYEERLPFLLIRLRNPHAHVVYVTSQPVHPMILDYYLNLLAGVPAAHARARLTMLCCHDASPRPLTEKILSGPGWCSASAKPFPICSGPTSRSSTRRASNGRCRCSSAFR
ncbi:MAG: hypothetical protein R2712_14100 [Vicinamibacterales bacterium]